MLAAGMYFGYHVLIARYSVNELLDRAWPRSYPLAGSLVWAATTGGYIAVLAVVGYEADPWRGLHLLRERPAYGPS